MAKFTKQAIRSSFIKLLNARPFNKISVKDIVEDCGVNRNTFYYYYQDIYDLLDDVFREELSKTNTDIQDEDDLLAGLLAATDFMMKNRRAVYHIYNSINRKQVEDYLNNVIENVLLRFVNHKAAHMQVKEADIRLIAEFNKCALAGMILQWLDRNMQSEGDLADLLQRMAVLFSGNIENSLKQATRMTKLDAKP